jgi:hypothetical protein
MARFFQKRFFKNNGKNIPFVGRFNQILKSLEMEFFAVRQKQFMEITKVS